MTEDNSSNRIQQVFVGIGVLAGICGLLSFFFGVDAISDIAMRLTGQSERSTDSSDGSDSSDGWDSSGGSDSSGATGDLDSPSPSPFDGNAWSGSSSKASYVQDADAICKKWYRESGKLDAKVQQNPDTEPSWQTYSQILAVGNSMITEWGALPPPEGGEAEIEEFLDREREGAALAERQRDALFGVSDESLEDVTQDFNEWDADTDSWRARARSYGFRVCLS
ncbi:hypothetical protein [Streptomyces sp. NPDC018833]|uniref:hypothetical protein n=1 Tax=Streptomyces sp. NPDC018833 TaxID=3365053 RepID=UPI0037942901